MDRETALNKIRKLLALGTSPNPAESEAALAKAQALMEEFELSHAELDAADCEWVEEETWSGATWPMEMRHVNQIVGFFSVEILQFAIPKRYRDAIKGTELEDLGHRKVLIFGSPERVAFAKYAWVFLIREFRRLWSAYRKRTGASAKSKRSYYAGLEHGFSKRIRAERDARAERYGQENALRLVREEQRVSNALAARNPDIKTVARPDITINSANAFWTGMREGGEIELRKPLSAPEGQRLIGSNAQ